MEYCILLVFPINGLSEALGGSSALVPRGSLPVRLRNQVENVSTLDRERRQGVRDLKDKLLARVGKGVVSDNADDIAFTSLGLRTPDVFLILDFKMFTVAETSNSERFLSPGIHKD